MPREEIAKVLNNTKMKVLGVTYADKEQFEPFNRTLTFINELENNLLNDDRAYKYNGQTTEEVLFDLSNEEVSVTEEKKAIEHLKQIIKSYIEADECGLSNNDFKKEIQDLSIVLNLINDQQKEIKEKDKQIDRILTDITEEKISRDDWCKCMILHTGCKEGWTCKECCKEYYFNKGRNV